MNRIFVLSFGNNTDRKMHTGYYLPTVEIKVHKNMIDGRTFFEQLLKSDMRTYGNIRKTAAGQDLNGQVVVY